MKSYIVMYVESNWYSLNVYNHDEYTSSLNYIIDDVLVTHQVTDLIAYFKSKKVSNLPSIIDLESYDKQMSQEGKEFKSFKKWTAFQSLKHHKILDNKFKLTEDNFKTYMTHLADLYLALSEKDEIEKKRYETIEKKINRIIYNRQLKGVKIDSVLAKERCKQIEKEIYRIKNILQFEHNIYTPEDELFQKNYLKQAGYKMVKSFEYTFKTRKNIDKVCELLYELMRSIKNLNSLIYTTAHFGGDKRTHPYYVGFGTITSRITLRQPSLQNLHRDNRDIIIPDDNMKLLYVDYSQFEAGILASLSDDKDLIDLYNTDIYTDLADKVLNDKNNRDDAKIIFYRYMYGDDTLTQEAQEYFKSFIKLEEYRKKVYQKINSNGRVGTIHGNYRRKQIENDEFTWGLSHVIQSTASLIYKNALISTNDKVESCDFLIPMHDGTLYQIPISVYEETKSMIKAIYEEEFKRVCPKLEARVTLKEEF
ncbi:hypothetical protein EZY14_007165 [Kordia sp. TARA_039_SRF]|nr:hypothetical protein EZY14_007165 [Kordia sp. TARA_039_SRF]